MQTAEIEMIKKLIVFSTGIYLSCVATAGFFNKEIKVKNYACDDKNKIYPDVLVVWTFTVEKNSVIKKTEFYEERKLKNSDLKRLDNCIVVDKANWKCGGDKVYPPRGDSYTNAEYKVVSGKYSFIESTFFNKTWCKIEQVN
jgi:hypothetical protein